MSLRPCPPRNDLTVRNMIDHLRIEHRRRLARDVSMKELGLVWDYYHPTLDALIALRAIMHWEEEEVE